MGEKIRKYRKEKVSPAVTTWAAINNNNNIIWEAWRRVHKKNSSEEKKIRCHTFSRNKLQQHCDGNDNERETNTVCASLLVHTFISRALNDYVHAPAKRYEIRRYNNKYQKRNRVRCAPQRQKLNKNYRKRIFFFFFSCLFFLLPIALHKGSGFALIANLHE